MPKYRLVTGFYPSIKTAEKILDKIKGNCKNAKIEEYEDAYTIILAENNDYEKIDDEFSKYMKLKIYCGIMETSGK